MLSKAIALALSFVASAAAQSLTITNPGPNTWWVAESTNTLAWSPCDTTIQGSIPAFNVVVMNADQTLLPGNLTILGNQMTYECSKTITPAFPVGAGYTMFLTNAINTLQVYTTTTFELKAKGSTYPSPSSSSSASPSSTGNATTAASTSASATPKNDAPGALHLSLEMLLGVAVGVSAVGVLL